MQAVETARLRLRMITTEDAEFIQRLYSSEDFLRYIGDKEITNTAKAEEYIENNILKMHQEKGGLFVDGRTESNLNANRSLRINYEDQFAKATRLVSIYDC